MPGAEQFLFRRRLHQKCHRQLQRFALIPDRLGRRVHGRLSQRGDDVLLPGRQPRRERRHHLARAAFHRGLDDRVKHVLRALEVLREKRAGELDREELMALAGGAPRPERLMIAIIESDSIGCELGPSAPSFDKAVPRQVQAEFDATGMKARSPIELALRNEVVPFDGVTRAPKAPEQRLPAGAHVAPRLAFRESRALVSAPVRRLTFRLCRLSLGAHRSHTCSGCTLSARTRDLASKLSPLTQAVTSPAVWVRLLALAFRTGSTQNFSGSLSNGIRPPKYTCRQTRTSNRRTTRIVTRTASGRREKSRLPHPVSTASS